MLTLEQQAELYKDLERFTYDPNSLVNAERSMMAHYLDSYLDAEHSIKGMQSVVTIDSLSALAGVSVSASVNEELYSQKPGEQKTSLITADATRRNNPHIIDDYSFYPMNTTTETYGNHPTEPFKNRKQRRIEQSKFRKRNK